MRLGRLFLSVTLATVLAVPSSSWASEPVQSGVQIEVAEDIAIAFEVLGARIRDGIVPQLVPASVAQEDVRVSVAWEDVEAFLYRVEVAVEVDGQAAPVIAAKTCERCNEDELVETAMDALTEALIGVRKAREKAAEPEPTAEAEPVSIESSPQLADQPRGRVSKLGWAGIGLGVAGAASLATGIGFLIIDNRPASGKPTKIRNFTPAGIGLAAGGGAVLVAGAVMIALDRVRAKKRRSQVAVVPQFGSGFAGFSAVGHF